jgi:hypothetical protein
MLVVGMGAAASQSQQYVSVENSLKQQESVLLPQIIDRCGDTCEFTVGWPTPGVKPFIGVLWDFGDGTTLWTKPSEVAKHDFDKPGDYIVTATIVYPDSAPIVISTMYKFREPGDWLKRTLNKSKTYIIEYGPTLAAVFAAVLILLGYKIVF